jgi:hypothetical protein
MAVFWVVAPCSLVEVYHGATTKKAAIFILTAVRTSNPTGLDSSGSVHDPVVGSCEHGNEPSD